MSRMVGTVSRGVRAPIIRKGDPLSEIVVNSVLEAAADDGFEIRDRDIVAMTEAIVARAQGNDASVDDIAQDVREKFGGETVKAGNILVRQRGTKIHPGINVGIGSDDTLFALTDGVVKFEPHRRTRKQVSVYSA